MSRLNGQSADEDLFYQLLDIQNEFDLSNSEMLEVIGMLLQRWALYIQNNGVSWNE